MLTLYLAPSGKLYLRLQEYVAQEQTAISLPLATPRHPGPKKLRQSIPPTEWPNILRSVFENQEPLRKVADDYGVSYETIRRIVIAARKQGNAG